MHLGSLPGNAWYLGFSFPESDIIRAKLRVSPHSSRVKAFLLDLERARLAFKKKDKETLETLQPKNYFEVGVKESCRCR